MQCAARSSGRVMLNDPRWDLASGVRLLATMTASRMYDQFYMRIIRLTEVAMRRIIVLALLVAYRNRASLRARRRPRRRRP